MDSTSKTQLQTGFNISWKLCLNLCSRKWLRSKWSLAMSLIPLWFSKLKTLLEVGLMNFMILFIKTLKLLPFLMLWSRLFHSITTEGKNYFLKKKKKMFRFDKGIFSAFLVVWEKCLKGSNLKRYWVDSFLKNL